ncbi:hypothetical protein HY970_00385 [Candidatus Kaiserbacteria bacterium]|nr:hypothetical protein [Candidatus Kaiserbacteria bacterium]
MAIKGSGAKARISCGVRVTSFRACPEGLSQSDIDELLGCVEATDDATLAGLVRSEIAIVVQQRGTAAQRQRMRKLIKD